MLLFLRRLVVVKESVVITQGRGFKCNKINVLFYFIVAYISLQLK